MPRLLRRTLEIAALCAIVFIIDVLTPGSAIFAEAFALPYLLIPPLIAAFYSIKMGVISVVLVAMVLFLAHTLLSGAPGAADSLFSLVEVLRVSFPLTILFSFIFGGIVQIEKNRNRGLRERMRSLAKTNWALKRKSEALFESNGVLENRVSGQTSSMSLLYNQMGKFSNVSVRDTLTVLLDTVEMFIGAEQSSVWEYYPSVQQLRLVVTKGWNENAPGQSVLSVNDSIEGWVIRNGSFFSYRMILGNEFLQKLDEDRSIITVPIMIENRPWGVLNIEALPFTQYSEYSEKVLQIIAKLVQPFLQHAIEYERMFQKQEADEITGLPLYSQFRAVLSREIERSGISDSNISVIIAEITNIDRLLQDFELDDVKRLILRLIKQIDESDKRERYYFHYRRDTQIALVCPNTDLDGTSMLSLDILSFANSTPWEIKGHSAPLELIIGHAHLQGSGDADELLNQAENLLEMQRI